MQSIPLCAARDPRDIVAWRNAAPGGALAAVSLARFLADVADTARRLPPHDYVINLCADRYRFMVGLAAGLQRRQANLLPPSAAPETLARIAARYARPPALVDPGVRVERVDHACAVHAGEREEEGEVPAFEPGQLAVVAFTSGSTGQPQPQPKTWGSLTRGAAAEAAALQLGGGARIALVGTVPPQHMYGLESTVLLGLHGGCAVHAGRPLYPADVAAALAELPGERVLVTTPVHLRALLVAEVELPALRLIVSATAPLPAAMARQAEARFAAPLHEIYGFTEAGMVASRRTAVDEHWHALPGVALSRAGEAVRFGGGHVEREVACSDLIELLDGGRFLLRGRGADMVNVAGKRTSLAHLDHALRSVPGVEDGVFFMPDDIGSTGDASASTREQLEQAVVRPIAFVVAPTLAREALLAALRSRIDPVFLPRPLYFVRALPRNATGKLPREALSALAADCARGAARGATVRMLAADHPLAQGHFPGNPVLPGAVLLDHVMEAAQAHRGLHATGWAVPVAKFLEPVRPGDMLRIEFAPRAADELGFDCFVGERPVASGRLRPCADADTQVSGPSAAPGSLADGHPGR
jgi:acyl-coenzyme A synthetase/AMP-(fatty) acid ligase